MLPGRIVFNTQSKNRSSQKDDAGTVVSGLTISTSFVAGIDLEDVLDRHHDFPQQILVGREKESEILLQAFDRVKKSKGASEVVVIHGVSGCGKSSLVEQALRNHVVQNGGYFVMGKTDQVRRKYPFAEIIAAFSDLIDVMSQDQDERHQHANRFRELGKELSVLLPLLPGLKAFVLPGSAPQMGIDSAMQTSNCFAVALRNMLKALSSVRHPIVVFFDDVQWMDRSSTTVLEFLINDTTTHNVLLICAYREKDRNTDLNKIPDMFSELSRKSAVPICDLPVKNLDELAVSRLLQLLLHATDDEVFPLAKVCFTRTLGNCFFLRQFLALLKYDGLLTPPTEDNATWTWDTAQIQSRSVAAENVLSILQARMSNISGFIRFILCVASNLGFEFSRASLELVVTSMDEDTSAGGKMLDVQVKLDDRYSIVGAVDEAIRLGLIEDLSGPYLKFTHDQVQLYFYDCIEGENQRELLNLKIGQVLKATTASDPDILFQVADNLNRGQLLLRSQVERIELAEINLSVANASAEKSAFVVAAEYMTLGLRALDHHTVHKWRDCYRLTMDLSKSAAKMYAITGQFEACRSMIDLVEANAQHFDERFEVGMIKSDLLLQERKLDETVQTCVSLVRELGEKIPKKPNGLQVLLQLMRTRRALWRMTSEKIMNLPLMEDKKMLQIAEAFFAITTPCFVGGDPLLGAITSLRFVEIAVQHGVSSIAAVSFGLLAVIEQQLGHIDKAYEYAMWTHQLINDPRLEAEIQHRGRIYIGTLSLILHWRKPVEEMIAPLQNVYIESFDAGDVIFGGFGCNSTAIYEFHCGISLSIIECHLNEASEILKNYNQEYIRMYLMPLHQLVLNLLGEWGDQSFHLTGEVLIYDDYLLAARERNHHYALSLLHFWRLTLAVLFNSFGNAESALIDIEKAKSEKDFKGHCNEYFFKFYAAITYFSLARKTKSRQSRHLRRCAEKNLRALDLFASKGCSNVVPLIAILKAEQKIGLLKADQLIAVFEDAMEVVRNGSFKHMVGLCCEHLGMALVELDDGQFQARAYLEMASQHYEQWEAMAKVDQINGILCDLSLNKSPGFMDIHMQIKG